MKQTQKKKETWEQMEKRTGINIAILKARPVNVKREKVRGITI